MTSGSSERRVGVLGGSFDPVHLGHLLIAQEAYEAMNLDRVIFMPACRAPLKNSQPGAQATARLQMVRDAVDADPRFLVSDLEIKRGGESFTVDTARELRQRWPDAALYWIIGADQAGKLGEWRLIGELGRLVEFIVLARPGFCLPNREDVAGVKLHPVATRQFDISSSEIRERVRSGLPVNYFLPEKVREHIERESLYR